MGLHLVARLFLGATLGDHFAIHPLLIASPVYRHGSTDGWAILDLIKDAVDVISEQETLSCK